MNQKQERELLQQILNGLKLTVGLVVYTLGLFLLWSTPITTVVAWSGLSLALIGGMTLGAEVRYVPHKR